MPENSAFGASQTTAPDAPGQVGKSVTASNKAQVRILANLHMKKIIVIIFPDFENSEKHKTRSENRI